MNSFWNRTIWGMVCGLLFAGILFAHPLEHPKILDVVVTPEGFQVRLLFHLNRGPDSEQMRGDFDANRNHHLEAGERERLLKRMRGLATFALEIQMGGKPVLFREVNASLHGVERTSSRPLGIEIERIYPVKWGPQETPWSLADSLRDRQKTVQLRLGAERMAASPAGVFHLQSGKPFEGVSRVQTLQ